MIKKFMRGLGLLMVALVLGSCSQQKHGTALIHGSFTSAPGIWLIIEELVPAGTVPLDSLTTDPDGTFRFDVSPDEATFYLLKTSDGKMAVLTAAPGDTLELACDLEAFPEKMVVKGPEDAVLLADFYAFSYKQKARSDSLQAVLSEHSSDSLFMPLTLKFDSLFREIWEEQRTYEMSFIGKHPGSIASLIAVNYSFGTRPVLSMKEDLNYYLLADSALLVNYPGNKHVQYFHKKIEEFTRKQQLEKDSVR
jgi:hypothetical protein